MPLLEFCIKAADDDCALGTGERKLAEKELAELRADAARWRGFRSAGCQKNETWLEVAIEIMNQSESATAEQIDRAADQANAAVGWPT